MGIFKYKKIEVDLSEYVKKEELEPEWVDIPITNSRFTPSDRGYGAGCSGLQYKKIGNHVYIRAGLEVDAGGLSGTTIANLPEEILPKLGLENKQASVGFLFAGTGQAIGRGQVSCYQGRNDLSIDYLRNFSTTNYNITAATWIGFYFDYYID